jgi:hypothetical protein
MVKYEYPLHPYFKEMPSIGKELARALNPKMEALREQEALVAAEI